MKPAATRLLVAFTALGLAAPTYTPGDTITVDGATVTAPAPGNAVALTVDRIAAPSTTLLVSTDADGTVSVDARRRRRT